METLTEQIEVLEKTQQIPSQKEIKIVGKIDLQQFEKKKYVKVSVSNADQTNKTRTFQQNKPVIIKKENVKPVEIKPTAIIHFFKDKNEKIIGKAESGKIAIIDYNSIGKIKENEDWLVSIEQDLEKKIIVKPIELILNAEANQLLIDEKLKGLTTKDWNKPTGKVINVFGKQYDKRRRERN